MISRRLLYVPAFFLVACLWCYPACSSGTGTGAEARGEDKNIGPAADLHDIKSPLPPEKILSSRFAGGVVFMLLGLVLAGVLQRGRKSFAEASPDGRGEDADAALASLREKHLGQPEDTQLFYEELAHLVRGSLAAVAGIPALRLTTEELLRETTACNVFPAGGTDMLRDFLQLCDLVKFAGYVPSVTDIERSLTLAGEIIRLLPGEFRA